MATRRPPIYREQGEVHHADTCQPVVEAVRRGELSLHAWVRGTYPGRPLPAGMLRQIKSIGYWDAVGDQSWGLELHRNEGIELMYVESGEQDFGVERDQYHLLPGDLAITRPWQPHRIGNPAVKSGRLHWLILDLGVRQPHQPWRWPPWIMLGKKDLAELTAMLRRNEQPVWRGSHDVQHCFQRIAQLIEKTREIESATSWLTLRINELLIILLDMLRKRSVPLSRAMPRPERSAARFLAGLDGMLAEPWTIQTMAECAGMKRTRFAYYCKRLKNMTPMQYLNHRRVDKACRLLGENTRRNLTDIALECGFESGQYFASVFKKVTGLTPSQWRDRHADDRNPPPPGG